jgi:hypothetical protein
MPQKDFLRAVNTKTCQLADGVLCESGLNSLAVGDTNVDMYERLPVILSYLFSGSGYKT